jgi:DNA replication and repair protein RecF
MQSGSADGHQRSAAVALKMVELVSLRSARGTEPALLIDGVFAELDRDRQQRLARRVLGNEARQVFVTAPRRDELPREVDLPVWNLDAGRVSR